MFDERLQKGVTFTLDAAAAKELGLDEGQVYALSQHADEVNARGKKFVDGKPSRGRPRKFSTRLVVRLLGLTDVEFPTTVASQIQDTSETEEVSESESEAAVAELLNSTEDVSSDQQPW